MATHIVQRSEISRPQAVRMNFRRAGSRFFSPAIEMLDLYFRSPKMLDYLDTRFRAKLPVRDRTMLDADLSSVPTI